MSAGHSDLIPSLSTSTPLGPNESVTTSAYIPGQYSSLSITCFPATTTEVEVQFSGDGVNWDVNEFKSFSGGSGGVEGVVVISKWVRLRFINTTGSAQAYLRVYTYGTIRNSVVQAVLNLGGGNEINIGNLPGTSGALRSEHARTLFSFNGASIQPCDHSLAINQNSGNKTFSIDSDAYQLAWSSPSPATNGLVTVQGGGQTGQRSLCIYSANGIGAPSLVGDGKSYLSPRYTSANTTGNIVFSFVTDFSGKLFSVNSRGNFFTPAPAGSESFPVRNQVLVGVTTGVSNGALDSAESFALFGAWDENYVNTHTEMNIVYNRSLTGLVVLPQSQWNVDPCDGTRLLPAMDLNNYPNSGIFLTGRIVMNFSMHGFLRWEIAHPFTGVYYPVHIVANAFPSCRLFCALIHRHRVTQQDMAVNMVHAFQSLEEEILGSDTHNVTGIDFVQGIASVTTSPAQTQIPILAIRKRSRDFPSGQVSFTNLSIPYERHMGEMTRLQKIAITAKDTGGNADTGLRFIVKRLHQYQIDDVGWTPVNPQGWVTSAEVSTTFSVNTAATDNMPQTISNFLVPTSGNLSDGYFEISNTSELQNLFWTLYPGSVIVLYVVNDIVRDFIIRVRASFINKT